MDLIWLYRLFCLKLLVWETVVSCSKTFQTQDSLRLSSPDLSTYRISGVTCLMISQGVLLLLFFIFLLNICACFYFFWGLFLYQKYYISQVRDYLAKIFKAAKIYIHCRLVCLRFRILKFECPAGFLTFVKLKLFLQKKWF